MVVENANGIKYGADQTYTPQAALGLRTDQATGVSEEGATLNGSLVGNGSATHYYFEWGPTAAYGNTSAAPPGEDAGSPSGPSTRRSPTTLTGLSPYTTYHYRVVATSGGGTSHGEDRDVHDDAPGAPSAQGAAVTAVHSDRVVFHGQINPNGADTPVHFEYVDDADLPAERLARTRRATTPRSRIGMSKQFPERQPARRRPQRRHPLPLPGGRHQRSRAAAATPATFRTFAFIPSFSDPCPNAHVRQQTGAAPAARLPRLRAGLGRQRRRL